MVIFLLMLMAYSLIGEQLHEIIGTIMFLLFLCHNWLNRGFWKGIFIGKTSPQKIFRIVVNTALLAAMILQPISGAAMSKQLYAFLPTFDVYAGARQIHMPLAYWTFVLMSIHIGMHFGIILNKAKKTMMIIIAVLSIPICGYGVYAFFNRQIGSYLFMQVPFVFFDFNEPRALFFIDYIAIMILLVCIGFLNIKGIDMLFRNKKN